MIFTTPYSKGVDITKSDTVDFVNQGNGKLVCDGIYVGGAGVVAVIWPDGSETDFTCIAGQILPVRARRVNATNTTATLMKALYFL